MSVQVIVLRKGEYLIEEKTENYTPKDIILSFPRHASSKSLILKNFVKITLINPWSYYDRPKVTVKYKDILLDRTNGHMEQVFSNIMTFKDYTKQELDDLKENIIEEENNKSITSLEEIISKLKIEKTNLEKEVNKLKEVKSLATKIQEYATKFIDVIEPKNKEE